MVASKESRKNEYPFMVSFSLLVWKRAHFNFILILTDASGIYHRN
jgi:hypothetical protein